ncbi:LamG-like jellyroll fold domain-containing protein [Lewinella sp. IMCC34183]|uniref:LamG-like jellyroll fold domain-containing protein n=1 Tax=Lewinella sp. IMCC34183 TaxID=2248762 RepID=UPI000E23E612|nr:LamG-like jellyroll fold domain-containing protein [Lewinella sp. IMCC34183]
MRLLFFLLCFLPVLLPAQTTVGLNAFYPFEGNLGDATGEAANLGVAEGVVDFDCGVDGAGLLLLNPGDYVRIPGGASNNVNRLFDDSDFTVSFNFRPLGGSDEQYLFSKQDTTCAPDGAFLYISYVPDARRLTAVLQQGSIRVELTHDIDNSACWQLVTLVRDGTRIKLYLNRDEVASQATAARIDLDNTGDILLGGMACAGPDGGSFRGLLDQVRIYDRPLSTDEIRPLYRFPDRILTPDSQLFLGESIDVRVRSSCGTEFSWSPTTGVVPPDVPQPTITPTEAGRQVYILQITDDRSTCVATDSLILTVINPDSLDCNEIFLPKAFTPNGIGPEINETFGISNPFAVPDLVAFEIFDRNGGRMFATTDAFTRWDGTFRGKPVNPGVQLWKLVYRCEGEEVIRTGSVTILR